MSESIRITRLRPLFVLKILYDNTDEFHAITIAQILQILNKQYGISSYRKTIKEDIDLLIAAGYKIDFIKSSQNQYQIVSRPFEINDLKIMIDAISSSKFINSEKSQELVRKIDRLGGPFLGETLSRNIDVERRVKYENKQLFSILDVLNAAINQEKKVAFKYFSYNVKKEKKEQNCGFAYKFSPYRLVWNGDYYYVVGYSDKYEIIDSYRIDRISTVPDILNENAVPVPKDFDINNYIDSMFRTNNEVQKEVELICDNSVMDSILNYFGEDVDIYAYDMESFRIIVNTAISSAFYSWVFSFSGKIKIRNPEEVKKGYERMVFQTVSKIKGTDIFEE